MLETSLLSDIQSIPGSNWQKIVKANKASGFPGRTALNGPEKVTTDAAVSDCYKLLLFYKIAHNICSIFPEQTVRSLIYDDVVAILNSIKNNYQTGLELLPSQYHFQLFNFDPINNPDERYQPVAMLTDVHSKSIFWHGTGKTRTNWASYYQKFIAENEVLIREAEAAQELRNEEGCAVFEARIFSNFKLANQISYPDMRNTDGALISAEDIVVGTPVFTAFSATGSIFFGAPRVLPQVLTQIKVSEMIVGLQVPPS